MPSLHEEIRRITVQAHDNVQHRMLLENKVSQLEGDLNHWRQRRMECADEGTRRECEEQISYIQNDLNRLQDK